MTKRSVALAAAMILAGGVGLAHATSNHDYKKNEYSVIEGGTAPNGLLSISAHGSGELGNARFHLYLTVEPAHKVIAPLAGIGSDDVLDTAPDAFHAEWSTDSRHVAVLFRPDRHVVTMQLYKIRDRRAHLLSGPDLIGAVGKSAAISARDYRLRSSIIKLRWLSPTRFALEEHDLLSSEGPALTNKIGKFGRPNAAVGDGDAGEYFLDFSAQAVGEFAGGSRYRILDIKPGPFDQ
jgi:hypothetical protein